MPRPAPVPGVAVLRSTVGLVVALVAGGVLVLVLFAVSGSGVAWWAVVAGGFGCASGLVLGTARRTTLGLGLGLVAVGAVVIAVADAPEADRRAAFPARERLAIVPGSPRAAPDERARASAPEVADEGRAAARADEGDATTAPAGGPVGATKPPAAVDAFVRSYYAALDAGDFDTAWARLSPQVRAGFGAFASWRDGYGSTLGHRVEDIAVESGGVVRHTLVALDETACGNEVEQTFGVTWRLAPGGDGLVATELSAVKLAGEDPTTAC
jgi:hypothetical protein